MGYDFLDSITARDEIWIQHCEPQPKQQSVEWKYEESGMT
jgi:hypothetical protein